MKTETAKAAQAIRKVLKERFPSTKFSVQSKSYSMGSHVNVSWTDGPREDQVRARIGHFQMGQFDGMTDSYEYTNKREGLPQTKFLFLERKGTPDKLFQVWDHEFNTEKFCFNAKDESEAAVLLHRWLRRHGMLSIRKNYSFNEVSAPKYADNIQNDWVA